MKVMLVICRKPKKQSDINKHKPKIPQDFLDAVNANDLQKVKKLSKSIVNINSVNANGQTALMVAAAKGYTKCAELLIKAGIDINAVDNKGNTALMLAAKFKQKKCFDALLKANASIINFNHQQRSVLHYALEVNSKELVIKILNSSELKRKVTRYDALGSVLKNTFGIKESDTLLKFLYSEYHAATYSSSTTHSGQALTFGTIFINIRDTDEVSVLAHATKIAIETCDAKCFKALFSSKFKYKALTNDSEQPLAILAQHYKMQEAKHPVLAVQMLASLKDESFLTSIRDEKQKEIAHSFFLRASLL